MAYRYIRKHGTGYAIVSKRTGRILSRHATRAKAQASFRAMEWNKHREKGRRR